MPVITHRRGAHRYVLDYPADEDLRGVCAAIIDMAKRPELGLGPSDLFALAERVAEDAAQQAAGRLRDGPQ